MSITRNQSHKLITKMHHVVVCFINNALTIIISVQHYCHYSSFKYQTKSYLMTNDNDNDTVYSQI